MGDVSGDLVVGVKADTEWVWVGVADHAVEAPAMPRRRSEATGGLGLPIVDAVASRWGSESRPAANWCSSRCDVRGRLRSLDLISRAVGG